MVFRCIRNVPHTSVNSSLAICLRFQVLDSISAPSPIPSEMGAISRRIVLAQGVEVVLAGIHRK